VLILNVFIERLQTFFFNFWTFVRYNVFLNFKVNVFLYIYGNLC